MILIKLLTCTKYPFQLYPKRTYHQLRWMKKTYCIWLSSDDYKNARKLFESRTDVRLMRRGEITRAKIIFHFHSCDYSFFAVCCAECNGNFFPTHTILLNWNSKSLKNSFHMLMDGKNFSPTRPSVRSLSSGQDSEVDKFRCYHCKSQQSLASGVESSHSSVGNSLKTN